MAQSLVKKYHYTGGGANTATFRHGLLDPLKNVRGCAWWLPPTKGAAQSVYPEGDWKSVLALSRLVLDPDVPKNGASFLLGRSIRLIRHDPRWECLVTYADEGQGHRGTIYLATNWERQGFTKPEAQWVDPLTGRIVAKKAGPKSRTKKEMETLGYEIKGRFRKRRFRMVIGSNIS